MTLRDARHAQAISSNSREAACVSETAKVHSGELDDFDIETLVSFFKLLDSWDREVKRNAESVQ